LDAFSYLSVLLSIIIGLAITQVLQGYRALLLSDPPVRLEPAPLIWSAVLLLAATQGWWSSFGLREHDDWNFLSFAIVLLQMVLLYMGTAVILPDARDGRVDLAGHFDRHREAFFGFLIAVLVVSVVKDLAISGDWPSLANLLFHATLGVIAVIGIFVPGRNVQTALAVIGASGFVVYIGLLFARL
jgi:hypothetical protein